jgi:aryl-alcohol dehydrogenase-like predicted oxidoreductase
MTFGKPADQSSATCMVNCCIEAGINFFDCANAYQHGEAESMLGAAISGKRHQLVVASKVHHKMGDGPDEGGLSKRAITRAIEDSLRRLQTDYLDIYYLHEPDYSVSMEETMDAMDTLVRQGKVRYVGASNYASWQVCQMHWIAEKNNYQAPSIAQPLYNLIARGIEQEFQPMASRLGVSTIVYNPLAGGLLTGKHDPSRVTPGTRFETTAVYQDRYWRPQAFRALSQFREIAAVAGRSLSSLAFNWLLHHTAATCVILGASRLEQLQQNLTACSEGSLSHETVKACDNVWDEFRGPAPIYNR